MAATGEKPDKIFYSMGEVAEMLDVNHSLIRFWEQKFDILKPKKNKKGNRMFSPEDVRNLKVIYHLVKERGMTLSGAQKYMKASRKQIERDMELAERLQSIRSLLAEVRDALGMDGTVMEEVFRETVEPEHIGIPPVSEAAPSAETIAKTTETVGTESAVNISAEEADALMREAMAELDDGEPDEMPDFNPETIPTTDDESTESGGDLKDDAEEKPKPLFIEQTLFDL